MISCFYASPIGPLELSAKAGRLVEVRFGAKIDTRFNNSYPKHPDEVVLDQARHELDEYFDGYRTRFDVPLALMGSQFQLKVWSMLMRIPFGKTVSYRDLASVTGDRNATRAVGAANAANPLPIFIPCHRVIGADGSLTGFAGGVDAKRALLDLEGAGASLFVGAMG